MNYFHVHLKVADLPKSIAFYNALFNREATVVKSDFAKWQLDNPQVNFAISAVEDRKPGLAHLGLQAENGTVLKQLYQQMKQAEGDIKEEGDTVCCYAKSEKSWIEDPEGI
jgi:catechol 2,3-dioxygenase-like lactoylglutathione lyase family enzyme